MTPAPATADSELASVARRGLANLVGAVVSAVTNFGLVFAVARLISAHDAGVFFAVTSGFLVLETIAKVGSDVSVVYFLARWRATKQTQRVRAGLRVACVPVAAFSVLLAVLAIIFAVPLARLMGDDPGRSVMTVRALACFLPVAAIYDTLVAATRGMDRMGPTVVIEKIARPTLQLVLVVLVFVVGWNAAVGYAWALPYLAGLLAVMVALRSISGLRDTALPHRELVLASAVEFWRFSVPRAVAGVAQILLQRLDIVLVAAMRGATEAAIYTAATRFLVVGQFVNQAIGTPLQPRLSAALALNDLARAKALFRATTAWIVLATWPLYCAAIVLAGWYVRSFGARYANGVPVVVILAIAMLVAAAAGPGDTVILMAGKSSWNLMTTLAALVVNVGLDVVLIPRHGLIGAAIGWFGAIAAANVAPLVVAHRKWRLDPYGAATLLACLLAAACFLAVPLLARWLSHSELGGAVGLVAGGLVYCAAVVACRHTLHLGSVHLMAKLRRRTAVVP